MSGKRLKRSIAAGLRTPVGSALMRAAECIDPAAPHFLRILTYHTIEDAEGFHAQLAYLRRRWSCVTEAQVLAALAGETPLPTRAVWITIDDADETVDTIAAPALREAGLPAMLFVPTGFPDSPDRVPWWDRIASALERTGLTTTTIEGREHPLASPLDRARALRAWKTHAHGVHPDAIDDWARSVETALEVSPTRSRTMGWDRIVAVAEGGMELGAHTVTHPFLDRLSPAEIRTEIDGSAAELRARTGITARSFAYPNGRYSPTVVEAVRTAGFEIGLSTETGTNDLRACDPVRLRRINVGPRTDRATLRALLLRAGPIRRSMRAIPPSSGGPRGQQDAATISHS